MSWLALDIGGANLKAADGVGFAAIRPFRLWQAPDRLATELQSLIADSPLCQRLVVTMTAELADCYETKAAGVREILGAVEAAAAGREIAIYVVDGRFVRLDEAREQPHLAAASNWHALAAFASRFVREPPGLLLDMGSTTTDIVPLGVSGPCSVGRTDSERLVSGELVYTGVGAHLLISAVVRRLPWRGQPCPVAAELFATTADAYILLGRLPEDVGNNESADGRPRTQACAHARLARMICADTDSFSAGDARLAAAAVRDAQLGTLQAAVVQVVARMEHTPRTLVVSGQGEFLVRELVDRLPWQCEVFSLSRKLGPEASRCAPAHALAVFARERSAKQAGG